MDLFVDSIEPGAYFYNLTILLKRILPRSEFKFKDTQKVLYYTQFFWQCKVIRLTHFFKIMHENFRLGTIDELKKLRTKFYNHRFYMLTTHKLDSLILFDKVKSFNKQLTFARQNKPSLRIRRPTTNKLDVNQRTLGLLLQDFHSKVPQWLLQSQRPEIKDRITSAMQEINSIQTDLLIESATPIPQQITSELTPRKSSISRIKSLKTEDDDSWSGSDSSYDLSEEEEERKQLMN